MFAHLVPNMVPQLLTFSLLGASITMILEGALDFLNGYGIPAAGPSWGNMIAVRAAISVGLPDAWSWCRASSCC